MLKAWGKKVSDTELEWRRRIVRFIEDSPASLQKLPSTVNTPESYGVNPKDASEMEVFRYAWPSRRSWDNLARVLSYSPEHHVVQDTLAQGIVGYEESTKFRDWLKRNSEISPGDLLANPKAVNWKKTSPDLASYLLRSVVDNIHDKKTASQVIAIFEEIARQGAQGIGAGFIRQVNSKVTHSDLDQDTIAKNRTRMMALAQAFSSITSKM